MAGSTRTLLIPVETQARELEPKLLLACVAARRGFSCVVGSRTDLDFRLAAFPPALYLSKSMTVRSRKVFGILRQLGHEILVWDEEALVTYRDPRIYYQRRLSPETIGSVSHLFAWGEANAELFRKYPAWPGTPIHVTGNPRGDLLRPELRACFAEEVAACRRRAGDFVLINTNFGNVNAFYPVLNLLLPPDADGHRAYGRGAVGMERSYVEGRAAHKRAIFEAFRRMIPFLHDAFPRQTVVVRPHPVEDPAPYHALAADHPRVRVVSEGGSPIPWLLAARALVHNSCTTGLEACALGVPTLAYRPIDDDSYEESLPNDLSEPVGDLPALGLALERILAGEAPDPGERAARERLLAHHVAALAGPLACERIVEVAERVAARRADAPGPRTRDRIAGRLRAARRRVKKTLKSRMPNSKNRPEFQRHRYPGLTVEEVRGRLARFQALLGDPVPLSVEPVSDHVYRIEPASPGRPSAPQNR